MKKIRVNYSVPRLFKTNRGFIQLTKFSRADRGIYALEFWFTQILKLFSDIV